MLCFVRYFHPLAQWIVTIFLLRRVAGVESGAYLTYVSISTTSPTLQITPYHNKLLEVEVLLNILNLLPLVLLGHLDHHLALLALHGLLLLV